MEDLPKPMNVLTPEGAAEYQTLMFTEFGYSTLQGYLSSLVDIYLKSEPDDYPFILGLVLDVPFFDYAQNIGSSDELYGRIKLLAQILGAEELKGKTENGEEATLRLN